MKAWHVDPAHEDDRGSIADILADELIEHVTMITTRAGAVRGNHYHRETYQWLYVMSGGLRYAVRKGEGALKTGVIGPGDVLMTGPMESHALQAFEDTAMVVMTRGPRGGREYESDTFRIDTPLITEGVA